MKKGLALLIGFFFVTAPMLFADEWDQDLRQSLDEIESGPALPDLPEDEQLVGSITSSYKARIHKLERAVNDLERSNRDMSDKIRDLDRKIEDVRRKLR